MRPRVDGVVVEGIDEKCFLWGKDWREGGLLALVKGGLVMRVGVCISERFIPFSLARMGCCCESEEVEEETRHDDGWEEDTIPLRLVLGT